MAGTWQTTLECQMQLKPTRNFFSARLCHQNRKWFHPRDKCLSFSLSISLLSRKYRGSFEGKKKCFPVERPLERYQCMKGWMNAKCFLKTNHKTITSSFIITLCKFPMFKYIRKFFSHLRMGRKPWEIKFAQQKMCFSNKWNIFFFCCFLDLSIVENCI